MLPFAACVLGALDPPGLAARSDPLVPSVPSDSSGVSLDPPASRVSSGALDVPWVLRPVVYSSYGLVLVLV
jgi:hypothetical protein